MIWLYDESIASDLESSFDRNLIYPKVKIIDPDIAIPSYAQIMDDDLRFPLICVTRDSEYQIDNSLSNFTSKHRGIATVFDSKTNNIYYEKSIPINIGYTITILSTNTVDVDELTREILFKYISMYFLTIKLPYEGNRKLRFGIEIDDSKSIEKSSGMLQYLSEGKLYQTMIPLRCQGVRLIINTPVKLKTFDYEYGVLSDSQMNLLKNNSHRRGD